MGWELGISRCKLLYVGWINNKVLLYSTRNYIQYPVINHNGHMKRNIYMYNIYTHIYMCIYMYNICMYMLYIYVYMCCCCIYTYMCVYVYVCIYEYVYVCITYIYV